MVKIGVLREGKVPVDRRVPLSPEQCVRIEAHHKNVEVFVQTSEVRQIVDEEYASAGIKVVDNVDDCDILLGVKEVPINSLVPNKTYLFFSHTIKKQPYNRALLQEVLKRNIQLVDYETITDNRGKRLIGFGKYAGIVGAYNTLLAYGVRSGRYQLKPAYQCVDRAEMEKEFAKIDLPKSHKIVLTGRGRVGSGATEILEKVGVRKVSKNDFLSSSFDEPVYTQLCVEDYNECIDGQVFNKQKFYHNPIGYRSSFVQYARVSDIYIACHYWDDRSPKIFAKEDMKLADWKVEVVGDISCDIDGPVPCTIRPSTIEEPIYGYDPVSEMEVAFDAEGALTVMAVDNLPCELPRDSSIDFGEEMLKYVLPELLLEEESSLIKRATIAEEGRLTKSFEYLLDYVNNKDILV